MGSPKSANLGGSPKKQVGPAAPGEEGRRETRHQAQPIFGSCRHRVLPFRSVEQSEPHNAHRKVVSRALSSCLSGLDIAQSGRIRRSKVPTICDFSTGCCRNAPETTVLFPSGMALGGSAGQRLGVQAGNHREGKYTGEAKPQHLESRLASPSQRKVQKTEAPTAQCLLQR